MSIHDALGVDQQKDAGIGGVASGIVTNNQDPDGLGRVMLWFPWLSEDNESNWARVATLMAGADAGSFFLPEVGDEVLVAFDHGDIDSPYVIGSLWNGKAAPLEDNQDGNNNIRTFKSRSGHRVTFDDNADEKKEKLELVSSSGHTVVLDDASDGPGVEITSSGGNSVKMDDKAGSITIKSGDNSIIIDSKSVSIESSAQLNIKANIVEIEGTTSLTLKSSTLVTIEGALVKIN
ncbi:MAG: phage tail protein [bacterium]|nr:phage tail protein [bacterium]